MGVMNSLIVGIYFNIQQKYLNYLPFNDSFVHAMLATCSS